MTADEIIKSLDLKPHPEGGYYRETFRDPVEVDGRAASTAIYFLLKAGQSSHWHRVDAVECWHHHAGAPLTLSLAATDDGPVETLTLGSALEKGERPQGLVPRGWWQAAATTGDWTLVGCTVAPGFTFDGFELAPPGWAPGVK